MKKILALVLTIVMLTLMVACGSDDVAITPSGELSRGAVAGDVYKNEFLGFEFHKPASWVYSTDEEIATLMNIAADAYMSDNLKIALENNPAIYDMMVIDSVTQSNLCIGYENLSKTFSTNITEEQYIDALKRQLSGVSGMTVTFPDTIDDVKLGNVSFKRCICKTSAYGADMTQVYYLRKVDGYMASVIVTITSGYTVSDIEAMFK